MSRQINSSLFTAATQNVGIAPVQTVDLGVTDKWDTLEIRATLRGRKDDEAGRPDTLFTFHGGSVMYSKESKNFFTAFMLRPFIYTKEFPKELTFNEQTGELNHSSVKCALVRKAELSIPEGILPMVSALKNMEESQRAVFLEMAKPQLAVLGISHEDLIKYLYNPGGVETKDLSAKEFLLNIFKHEDVRFKANIPSSFESKIESIQDKLADSEQKYSIILRFDLKRVNAIKEPVELKHYQDGELTARLHPVSNKPIKIQEVSLTLTYIGVEKGTTYEEDTTKFIDPAIVLSGAMSATKNKDQVVYMDYSIIEARASEINSWKNHMKDFNGKKFLQNSGILDELFALADAVAKDDSEAIAKSKAILKALEEDDRVDQKRFNSVKTKFQEKVEAAKQLTQPETNNTHDTGNPETVNSEEEIVEVDAINAALSAVETFDWSSHLGLNILTDEE